MISYLKLPSVSIIFYLVQDRNRNNHPHLHKHKTYFSKSVGFNLYAGRNILLPFEIKLSGRKANGEIISFGFTPRPISSRSTSVSINSLKKCILGAV